MTLALFISSCARLLCPTSVPGFCARLPCPASGSAFMSELETLLDAVDPKSSDALYSKESIKAALATEFGEALYAEMQSEVPDPLRCVCV